MKASIVIVARNEESLLPGCLEGALAQSVPAAEVIVVDHASQDGTAAVARRFEARGVRLVVAAATAGIAEVRNIGWKAAAGDAVFFCDADCRPSRYWVEEGLRRLQADGCAAIEGVTYYEAQPGITVRDSNTHQHVAGLFMTCNMVYRRATLEHANGFDPSFTLGHEDRELALRVTAAGEHIVFAPDLIVAHRRKLYRLAGIFQKARRAQDMVRLIRRHGPQPGMVGPILYPQSLACALVPPLLFISSRYVSASDVLFDVVRWFGVLYERLLIWRTAVRERILVL